MNNKVKAKKKMNIVLYTFLMAIVFTFITEFIIWGYGGDTLLESILNHSQGRLVVSEAVLAAMVLVVMLLFKNSYVFTQKKQNVFVGLYYGLFYLVGACLFSLMYGVFLGGFGAGYPLLNIALGSFLVGIAEEFLCRGWLLNEFLERYGDTKKGVWYSIIVSGVIFGLLHLGNIGNGQAVSSTVIQVLNAAATGIMLGIIYYKTKNIWSCVILHAVWDFSLFLGEICVVESNTVSVPYFSVIGIVFSIIFVIFELTNIIPHLKDIDAKPKVYLVVPIAFVSFGLYFVTMILSSNFTTKFEDTYTYDHVTLDNYSITKDNFSEYSIDGNRVITTINGVENPGYNLLSGLGANGSKTSTEAVNISFTTKSNNLIITNTKTDYSVTIKCEDLYDIDVIKVDNQYIIGYIDYTDSTNTFFYFEYINANELSNSNEFIDNIKANFNKYLITERSILVTIYDKDNDKTYMSAYQRDAGYYMLSGDKVVILDN